MTRDDRGRFIAGSAHRYALRYDDGRIEYVMAGTPSQAVNRRRAGRDSLLPHTLTDLTALASFAGRRAPTYPLLSRMYTGRTE